MELTQSRNIGWNKIFALAALDAAIVISWTAYHNFQPKLIQHFHFEHLSGFVSIAQSIVMLAVPLLAGWATDYYRKKTGSGFSVFAVGISVASLIFMAVSFTISDQAFVNLVWLLPTLIVFWLISMNIFHSPANSILEAFTKSPELPLMMSVLVICKILIHGLEPLLLHSLEAAGGSYTFLAGGVILVATGVWFARSTKNMVFDHAHGEEKEKNNFITEPEFTYTCEFAIKLSRLESRFDEIAIYYEYGKKIGASKLRIMRNFWRLMLLLFKLQY